MSRYSFLVVYWILSSYLLMPHALADNKPNLLVITIDDMSCDSVGAYGCHLADTTPNMDAFAKTALRFRYAHVQVGNCMPSRNVMWSGRYPHNNGVEGFYANKTPQYPVLCDIAKQAGYFTGIRHKVSHSTPYSPYAWDMDLDSPPDGSKPHIKDAASYGKSTTLGIEAAKAAGKPFCLLINISDPHKPFYSEVKQGSDPHVPTRVYTAEEVPVPGFLPDDPMIREELALYYSSVRRADDGVGAILEALDASGTSNQTIVIFLADHGMPLPFAKTQLYHHSTRTPLMVRWPGVTAAGQQDEKHMVSAVDLLPTILDMWALKHPSDLDGQSFASVLRGQSQPNRDFVIKEYNENSGAKRNPMRAIQDRQFLYLFNPWSNGTRQMATATNGTATYRRMKELAKTDSYVAQRLNLADFRTVEELYDVEKDPDCLHNLVAQAEHQTTLERLRNQLTKELHRTGDPIARILESRSPTVMEDYVTEVQAQADQRRRNKGKPAAPGGKSKREGLIQVGRIERTETSVVATIAYDLPKRLGEQSIFVTLKNREQSRIERQSIRAAGKGEVSVTFTLPSENTSPGFIAVFVGDDFATSLQHIQSSIPQ